MGKAKEGIVNLVNRMSDWVVPSSSCRPEELEFLAGIRAAGNLHWADFNENVQSTHSHLNPTTNVLAIDKSDPIS